MKILDGKIVKKQIINNLKEKISHIDKKLSFIVIQIGDNNIDNIYIRSKEKIAEELNYNFKHIKLNSNITTNEVINIIDKYNKDNNIDGIMVELPIPQNVDYNIIRNSINPNKDIEGVTDINMGKLITNNNGIISCTALAVIRLLKYYNIKLTDKNITIIGRSNLVGKPLANLLINENATITLCHSKTKNLKDYTKNADILIVCTGKPKFITKEMIKNNCIIIDVGTNIINGKLCGDADFDNIKNKTSYITPVPGGIGQITTAVLAENIYKCYMNNKLGDNNYGK